MHLVNMRTEMSWDILNRNRVLSKTTESQKTQLQGIMMERAWRGCRPLNRTAAHLHPSRPTDGRSTARWQ